MCIQATAKGEINGPVSFLFYIFKIRCNMLNVLLLLLSMKISDKKVHSTLEKEVSQSFTGRWVKRIFLGVSPQTPIFNSVSYQQTILPHNVRSCDIFIGMSKSYLPLD